MDRLEGLLMIALAAHYCTYVVTESALFAGVRSLLAKQVPMLGRMTGCYNCMAFWSALLMGAFWESHWFPAVFFVIVCAAATGVQFVMQWRWRTEP